jgi:putative ABC transport system permease protein
MKWQKLIKVALQSIAKNKMRSLLTMLGIIIGVASVIALVALGQGSQKDIQRQIASLGTNLLIIHSGSSRMAGVHGGEDTLQTLTMGDVARLREQGTLLQGVSPVISVREQVIAGRNNWNTSVTGVSPQYPAIRNYSMASGTFFDARDVKTRREVAVLGKTVADQLFPGEDPLGARIRIRNVPFKVIGVLAPKGQTAMGRDQDDVILAPSATVLYRLSDGKTVNAIMASAVSAGRMAAAKEQVGGIGIMNIMLVSVTERTREIGIRMAIGARPGDVLIQFLIEAVILSVLGGIIGILGGIGTATFLGSLMGTSPVISPGIIAGSVTFTGAVGIFFGFYPARKAANLNPIEALRYE